MQRGPRNSLKLELERLEGRCLLSGGAYTPAYLVADQGGVAAHSDSSLKDPWGLAIAPDGRFWVSDNTAGVSTIYDVQGNLQTANGHPLVINTPGSGANGHPTGAVYNLFGQGFNIRSGSLSASSQFLVDTLGGVIAGWNPALDQNSAIAAVDNSATGAQYTGLALGADAHGNALLYAANYAGGVEVYDASFQRTLRGSFVDSAIPSGFAPFNVRNLNGNIYVTFAHQGFAAGSGQGFVDIFDATGHLLQRLTSGGTLNLPWGMALAPSVWGQFANTVLVGNLGDGAVSAYNPTTGSFLGQVRSIQSKVIANDGLWSLRFGIGGQGGDPNTLYFTAGPNFGQHGILGSLTLVPGVDIRTLTSATNGSSTVTFTISTAGSVYRHDDASGWAKLGDNILSVSAVTETSGNVVLFAVTQDHALFRFDGARGWQQLGAVGTILSVSAGSDTNGLATAYVITAQTALTEYRGSSGWLGVNLGAPGTILSISAAGNEDIAVVSADRSVYEHDFTFGWFRLGSAGFAQTVSAVTDSTGFVVYAVTPGRGLVRHDDASGWSNVGGPGTIDEARAGLDFGRLANVFVRTTTGSLSEFSAATGWRTVDNPGSILQFDPAQLGQLLAIKADHSVQEFADPFGWFALTSPAFALD